jgi:DNA-binding response OmpR family regulator
LTQPISNAALLEAVERVTQRLTTNRQGVAMLALLQDGLKRMNGLAVTHAVSSAAEGSPPRQFHLGPVLLDVDRYVIEVNGKRVEATPTELEILHYLFRTPGRVVTAQELIQAIRGYRVDQREAPEIVRPHISNLRRKLVMMEPSADIIQTVRSVGYMLLYRGGAAR